jgi:hypothetical protein
MIAAPSRAALLLAIVLSVTPLAAPPARAADEPHWRAAWHLAVGAERMAKLHAQAGQGIVADRARRALAESVAEFDALQRRAVAAAPAGEGRDNALLLGLLWREYRPWLARAATRDTARRMAERTEELAWVALKGARMAQASAPPAAAEALRAGVLAQRVARLLLLRRWEIRDEAASRELATASRELGAIVERLRANAAPDGEIAAELQVAQNQLAFLDQAARDLAAKPASAQALEIAAKAGDNVLEAMRRASRLYEGAALSASAPR